MNLMERKMKSLKYRFKPRKVTKPFDWNEENISKLINLWQGGMTGSEIAKVMGVGSRSAVIGKLHRLGIKRGAENKSNHMGVGCVVKIKKDKPIINYTGKGKTLADIGHNECRWPTEGKLFCADMICDDHKSYCQRHAKLSRKQYTGA